MKNIHKVPFLSFFLTQYNEKVVSFYLDHCFCDCSLNLLDKQSQLISNLIQFYMDDLIVA